MITNINIANKGTRRPDFTYEDIQVIVPYANMFLLAITNSPSLARVEHDNTDFNGDVDIAKNLCLQKLTGETND